MADMYNDQRQKIGTKTIQQGAGLQRPDGSFGNGVTMNFAPPPIIRQPQEQQSQQNMLNNSYGGMENGVSAPKVQYEVQEGAGLYGSIIRNLAISRNAKMQQDYDRLNANLYDRNQDRTQQTRNQDQNRNQEQYLFDKKIDNSNQQFDREMDFKYQDLKYQNAVKNVMTPYQQAQINQKQYDGRVQSFSDDAFKSMLPQGVSENIDTDSTAYNQAKQQYFKDGTIPKFKLDEHNYFSKDDFSIDTNTSQQQQPPQNANQIAQTDQSEGDAKARAYRRYVEAKNKEIMGGNTSY